MIAAIYARKSPYDQNGADADAKSVSRQIESARAFAAARAWTVDDSHIYADDAVSGAETHKLVNRQRLLTTIHGGAPFQVLVMRDTSRFSRRDGDEAFAELKAIDRAGVQVWFYQDGQRFKHGTFGDNVVGYVKAEAAADYRRQIGAWTRAAMEQKARQGYVTGGRCFGYDNVRVDGHVERRVNDPEAAVVRRIHELYAAGHGLTNVAKTLNEEAAPRPTPQQGRPPGWAPSSVREVLRRPLYRGVVTWGRSKKRDASGQVARSQRPSGDVVQVEVPGLRIVPAALANAVDARLAAVRSRMLRTSDGRLLGRPPGEGARYLLTGLAVCHVCGAGLEALSRKSGGRRLYTYGCSAHRRKGPTVCSNGLLVRMREANEAVLATVETALLDRRVVERAVAHAEAAIAQSQTVEHREALDTELADTERAIARLTSAIATSGTELAPLVSALETYEQRRKDLAVRLTAVQASCEPADPTALSRQLLGYARNWRELLRANVQQGQQVLRRLIKGRLRFEPQGDHYVFQGTGTLRPLLGAELIQKWASPRGTARVVHVLLRRAA